MSAIVFEVREGMDASNVHEKGTGRYVAGFLGSEKRPDKSGEMVLTTHHQRATDFAKFLTAEHAGGRVPQALCGPIYLPRAKPEDPKVKAPRSRCDYERVSMPEMLTDAQRASLVMCEHHRGAFGSTLVYEAKP